MELGAGDGEYRSFTLPLERDLQWTGLLVEPNPALYKRLLKKGRKAQLAKTCVSPYSYPAKVRPKPVSPYSTLQGKTDPIFALLLAS